MKLSIAFISFMCAFLFGFGLATPPMSANELVSQAPDDAKVYIISQQFSFWKKSEFSSLSKIEN